MCAEGEKSLIVYDDHIDGDVTVCREYKPLLYSLSTRQVETPQQLWCFVFYLGVCVLVFFVCSWTRCVTHEVTLLMQMLHRPVVVLLTNWWSKFWWSGFRWAKITHCPKIQRTNCLRWTDDNWVSECHVLLRQQEAPLPSCIFFWRLPWKQ